MSIPLSPVDLTGLPIGASGIISLQNVGLSSHPSLYEKKPRIRIFNESGCGLQIQFVNSGNGDIIPAGSWPIYSLIPGESGIIWTILYALPSPPVSKVYPVYYAPGEEIPDTGPLGNSPIGIGGNVNVSIAQSISNDGNVTGTPVLEATVAGDTASCVKLSNDGVFSIGTSSHHGSVSLDNGTITSNGSGNITVKGLLSNNGSQTTIDSTQANNLDLCTASATGNINFKRGDGTQDFHSGPGLWLDNGAINFLRGSIARISKFTGTSATNGKVTVNHNLGDVPDVAFVAWNLSSAPSPHLIGCNLNAATSTQIDVWSDLGGVAFYGIAIKF